MQSKKVTIMLRTYDCFYQDVVREYVADYVSEDAAIEAAKLILHLLYAPTDQIEIQICWREMSRGEWIMFGAVFFDEIDGAIVPVYDTCFC